MANLNNDEKAKLYDHLLLRYQRLQEEVRQIKAKNFDLSYEDAKKIMVIETQMKKIFNDTQRLYS